MELMGGWRETIADRRPALQNWRMLGPCERLRGTFPRVREKRTKTSEDQRTKDGDGTNM